MPIGPRLLGKKNPLCKKFILCIYYIMAFSRRFGDSDRVIEAIFNDEFGLSDKKVSEGDDGNDVYGYLGISIVS